MDQIPLVDLTAQYQTIQHEINQAIQDVIRENSFVRGPRVIAFQEAFADYCGLPHAVGASSGTTALHLAFAALDIGPGDEVITSPNTFMATAETIAQTGARPVFVDVEEDTSNLDESKVRAAVTKKTRAIVPVHLYGHMADMDPILEIAREHDLPVVEDAAQAHGAEYKKKRAGHFGTAATYSFYPGKILGAYGDAGIVVTTDPDFARRMKILSDHGTEDKWEQQMPGFNYRLDGIQAAVLSVKLRYLEAWIEKRRHLAGRYNSLFDASDVQTPFEAAYARHVYTYYVVRIKNRDTAMRRLRKAGVDAKVHYPIPLHLHTAYRHLGYRKGDFPVAESQIAQILSLPLYAELKEDQIEWIADLLRDT